MQALLESLSRCFGAPHGGMGSGGQRRMSSCMEPKAEMEPTFTGSASMRQTSSSLSRRRRVALHDKEFDELFQDEPAGRPTDGSPRRSSSHRKPQSRPQMKGIPPPVERRRTSSSRKSDIFRSRAPTPELPSQARSSNTSAATLIQLFGSNGEALVQRALCFATPIDEDNEENELLQDKAVQSCDNTLNTNTDDHTVTSTLYFDNKYQHVVENRPPMPLFETFRVPHTDHRNELVKIVETDSHNSLNMIQLLQEHHPQDVSSSSASPPKDFRCLPEISIEHKTPKQGRSKKNKQQQQQLQQEPLSPQEKSPKRTFKKILSPMTGRKSSQKNKTQKSATKSPRKTITKEEPTVTPRRVAVESSPMERLYQPKLGSPANHDHDNHDDAMKIRDSSSTEPCTPTSSRSRSMSDSKDFPRAGTHRVTA
jgi:hypothetical protein